MLNKTFNVLAARLKSSTSLQLVMLFLLLFPSFSSLLRSGYFPMQDDQQAFRVNQMMKCFSDRQFPCRWVPDAGYGYGYPMFNYYPPSLYYLGGFFNVIGFQIIDAVKILFILGFIASGLAMFFLLREFFNLPAAYVGSFLYVYAPFRAVEVYVRGALSESWALAFFPVLFLYSFRAAKRGKRIDFIWLSVGVAFLLVTHIPMAVIFLPILVIWTLILIMVFRQRRRSIKFLASFVLGIGLAAFFIIPAILEKQFVHVETLIGGYFDYRQHFVSLGRLLFSNRWGYGSSNLGQTENLSLSTGIIHWTVALIAIILAILSFKKNPVLAKIALFLGVIELGILFMIHQKSSFIWERVSFLAYLQFPWRFLGPSIFLLSFLAALGIFICKNTKVVFIASLVIIGAVLFLHGSFFKPKAWLNISDKEKFSGVSWESQLTSSIFDYLPIYAKFPPTSKAPELPEIVSGLGTIEDYRKGADFQTGVVMVQTPVELRVPLYDFPGMAVYVNNVAVPHSNNDCRGEPFCLGLVSFLISSFGKNTIVIRLKDTPVRAFSNIFSLMSLLVVVLMIFSECLKRVFPGGRGEKKVY